MKRSSGKTSPRKRTEKILRSGSLQRIVSQARSQYPHVFVPPGLNTTEQRLLDPWPINKFVVATPKQAACSPVMTMDVTCRLLNASPITLSMSRSAWMGA